MVGILSTAKRLVAPTLAEGFDRLYRVRPGRHGVFDVREVERAPTAGGDGPAPAPT